MNILEFEKPIVELELKIEELKTFGIDKNIAPGPELKKLSQALGHSDLDARDSHNRPLRNPSAKNQLQELFTATVFQLLTSADLPMVSAIRKYLERLVNPLAATFGQAKKWIFQAMEVAVWCSFKRAIELLNGASPGISSLLPFYCSGFANFRQLTVPCKISLTLPLRC